MYYKEKTEALVVARKEICLEVNAEKTKYIFMSHEKIQDTITTKR
jgi:hypothetical protein